MSQVHIPPLFGDAKGHYRVKITGNAGSGKSTLGKILAAQLRVPYISLDELFWEPGWVQSSATEMSAKILQALDAADSGWVVDGNYLSKGGIAAVERATDIIWLDPPLCLYFPRIVLRTFLRLFRYEPPCSPGCLERWQEVFFSRDSILLWCLTHHWSNRKRNQEALDKIGISVDGQGKVRGNMRRLGGWGSELNGWLRDVERMVSS